MWLGLLRDLRRIHIYSDLVQCHSEQAREAWSHGTVEKTTRRGESWQISKRKSSGAPRSQPGPKVRLIRSQPCLSDSIDKLIEVLATILRVGTHNLARHGVGRQRRSLWYWRMKQLWWLVVLLLQVLGSRWRCAQLEQTVRMQPSHIQKTVPEITAWGVRRQNAAGRKTQRRKFTSPWCVGGRSDSRNLVAIR